MALPTSIPPSTLLCSCVACPDPYNVTETARGRRTIVAMSLSKNVRGSTLKKKLIMLEECIPANDSIEADADQGIVDFFVGK